MDEVDFHVYAMKEPDYVMSIMSTYGTNQRMGKETQRELVGGERKKFFYPEVIGNHFLFRHSVDDHNNKRHSPISIEEIWATKWWPNRVFAFLLAVTEVNASLGMVEFCDNAPTSQIEFRKKLADVLINNEYFNEEDDTTPVKKAKKQRTSVHSYCTLPKGKKFQEGRMVEAKSAYPQHKCTTCTCRPVAIASALQGYIAAMNVTRFILLVLKTIFHHHAKFRRKMRPKNDPSIITHTSE